MEEGRDFQSDCKLQLAPFDIHLIRKDDATVCSLLMQTRCHKFIPTLCILNEILTHSEVLRKTLQHRELIFPSLLSAVSYCHAKLDDILRRKDKILVRLGDDQAENDKFTEASTNFLGGFIQLVTMLKANRSARFPSLPVVQALSIYDLQHLLAKEVTDLESYCEPYSHTRKLLWCNRLRGS